MTKLRRKTTKHQNNLYWAYFSVLDDCRVLHKSEKYLRGMMAEQGPSPRIKRVICTPKANGRYWVYRNPVTKMLTVSPTQKTLRSWLPDGAKPKLDKVSLRLATKP
jgi:hypothetical protein